MKRIFTAIDISGAARFRCAKRIENLRSEFAALRVGWERPEKLHLTLKFAGDIDERQLENLTAAVEATTEKFSDFKISIAGTGAFPSGRNARILWLGVTDEENALSRLNEILESECEMRGFVREKRNFKPHLTIARLREPRQSADLAIRHLSENFESEEFIVSEITIYESRLQKSGSIYSVVSKHKFAKQVTADDADKRR